ncbi:MAG TPA: class I SAM-dependent methyltransferase [Bacillota bacterium]|nr:class I SAM-dependent methyltransferase [Bacillota bacterium]
MKTTKTNEEIVLHNKTAWNKYVQDGCCYTKPVGKEVIEAAKNGEWDVILTPIKTVPKEWFPKIQGLKILCLACGGGQQGPILAAAGADVTVFDNSPKQLEQDVYVATRDSLRIKTVEGDMRDLSCFENEEFDLIFHPVSNTFVPEILPVWKEAYRVLKDNGVLLSGFVNPFVYIFDSGKMDLNILEVKNKLPCSECLSEESAIEFSHTLETQIAGQIQAGFIIDGFYEDYEKEGPLAKYSPSYIATRAKKILTLD